MNDTQAEQDQKMYFYERFSKDFDSKVNMYDTRKRLSVFYDDMLTEDLHGKSLLDAGCGTGWFGAQAVERGAIVTSMDLGEGLLAEVAKKCDSTRVVGSIMQMPFADNTFDYVVSSEVIEHTPEPHQAIREIYRVLKPGGVAVVSTPNQFWYWSLWVAQKLNLRPYQGLENWSSWDGLRSSLSESGFAIDKTAGVHAFPFVISALDPVLDWLHRYRYRMGRYMVNIVMRAHKPSV